MVRDLNSILGYIERLNELNTDKVQPMAQVSDRYGVDESKQGSERFAYAAREDVREGLRSSLPHEEALRNAPDADGTFFRVPKVIEKYFPHPAVVGQPTFISCIDESQRSDDRHCALCSCRGNRNSNLTRA